MQTALSANQANTDFSGLWIPLVTPFDQGKVDHSTLKRLVAHYRGSGIAGLVVCGSTGEAAALDEDEQLQTLQTVMAEAPALPVVIEKAHPLIFRTYRPGDRLEKGIWNIPIPAEGDPVTPDITIAPLVGVDPQNYRLGYGGGFFDRTLASLPKKPLVIGVGYEMQRIPTIHPQPHDIPMDRIVTGDSN